MRHLFILILCFTFSFGASAQTVKRQVIQFSGVVVSSDSLVPVPYTNLSVRNSYYGTIGDYYGFFSFVAQAGDTINFSSIGYQTASYVIPSELEENRYSIIQVLNRDTIQLATTVIYAWPSREQIYEYFLTAPVPDDDLERARKNLEQETLANVAMKMPMDGSMNYRNTMNNYNTRLYNAGQIPMNNLLNPIAWAKFVEAWKRGDFKSKSK
ncbi:MAG: carboxypeptidase-like regulatory domain-containing protein [Bacteroidia bacterium]